MGEVATKPKPINAENMTWQRMGATNIERDPLVVIDGDVKGYYYPGDMALFIAKAGEEFEAKRTYRAPAPNDIFPRISPAVVLLLTESCNFACDYCYVMGQGRGHSEPAASKVMSDRTISRAIDLCGRDPVNVMFFGGEPLMAWDALTWAVERAEAKGIYLKQKKKPQFHITTNGSLLTKERAEFLKEKGFSLIISLDGPQYIHDALRKRHNGDGTYETVLKGLEVAKDAGLSGRITLRSTFTPELTEVDSRLEHLNDLCDRGLASGVAVEPAVGCGGSTCRALSAGWTQSKIQKAINRGFDYCISRALSGNFARWAFLNKSMQRLMDRMPAFTECGAGKGYVAVTPDGTVHACHKCNYPVGALPEGIDEDKAEPWIENRSISRPDCSSCWARYICGGGCRAEGVEEGLGIIHGTAGCMVAKSRSSMAVAGAVQLRNEPKALANLYRSRRKSK